MIIQYWLSTPDAPLFHEVDYDQYRAAQNRALLGAGADLHDFQDMRRGVFGRVTYGGGARP